MKDTRGQAYTLEGIIGAIVLASALIIGLQAVDPAPWTDSDPGDPEEIRVGAEDTLTIAQERDKLHAAVACVDGDEHESQAFQPGGTPLGDLLERTLGDYNYQLWLEYEEAGEREERDALDGIRTPDRQSVTVTRQVPLFDNSLVYEYDDGEGECVPTDETLEDADQFYIDNQHDDDELYAIVTVRVVVW